MRVRGVDPAALARDLMALAPARDGSIYVPRALLA